MTALTEYWQRRSGFEDRVPHAILSIADLVRLALPGRPASFSISTYFSMGKDPYRQRLKNQKRWTRRANFSQ